MYILVVSDLHSQQKILPALQSTVLRLQPQAVLCLGDLTVAGPAALDYTERFLTACGHPTRPVLAISGNNDDPASLAVLEQAHALVDYTTQQIGDLGVVGMGYWPPGEPFRPDLAGKILLTHVPPRRWSVPEYVADRPDWHFSGHLHTKAETWQLGKTTVVQVPSAMHLKAVLFEPDAHRVEFIVLT